MHAVVLPLLAAALIGSLRQDAPAPNAEPVAPPAQDAPAPSAPAKPATPPSQDAPPPAAKGPQPNLILVTMDTTRADHLGCYGYARPTTPQIDALAKESLVFERCYSALTHTTPSHASIMTGVYPFEHGVLACSFRADEDVQQQRALTSTPQLRTYAEILASHGWHNGGFVTAATTKKITGLGAGFAAWGEPTEEVRPGSEALAEALAWLDQVPEPFFLWFHSFDAHAPPREENRKYTDLFAPDQALRDHCAALVALPGGKKPAGRQRGGPSERDMVFYDAGLRLIDDDVAAIVAKVTQRGAWPRTTLVITGDHGEGLGQHNFQTHGPVWREQTHVPLIVRIPGVAPAHHEMVVSSIDVLATAAANTPGLPSEELLAQARGRNVLAADFEERPVFTMSPPRRAEFALTSSRWRWIRRESGDHALYDLEADPNELVNVRKQHADIAEKMDRQLLALIKDQRARNIELYGKHHGASLTPEAEKQLRAELAKLGYTEDDDAAAPPKHEDGAGGDEDEDAKPKKKPGGKGGAAPKEGGKPPEAKPADGAKPKDEEPAGRGSKPEDAKPAGGGGGALDEYGQLPECDDDGCGERHGDR